MRPRYIPSLVPQRRESERITEVLTAESKRYVFFITLRFISKTTSPKLVDIYASEPEILSSFTDMSPILLFLSSVKL